MFLSDTWKIKQNFSTFFKDYNNSLNSWIKSQTMVVILRCEMFRNFPKGEIIQPQVQKNDRNNRTKHYIWYDIPLLNHIHLTNWQIGSCRFVLQNVFSYSQLLYVYMYLILYAKLICKHWQLLFVGNQKSNKT